MSFYSRRTNLPERLTRAQNSSQWYSRLQINF